MLVPNRTSIPSGLAPLVLELKIISVLEEGPEKPCTDVLTPVRTPAKVLGDDFHTHVNCLWIKHAGLAGSA